MTSLQCPQKIGNALRTIDTWYPDFEEQKSAIAIEPYGAVTNLGKAYRTPKAKQDFFSLFDKYALGEPLENVEQEHYVMAVLVRGGVLVKAQGLIMKFYQEITLIDQAEISPYFIWSKALCTITYCFSGTKKY